MGKLPVCVPASTGKHCDQKTLVCQWNKTGGQCQCNKEYVIGCDLVCGSNLQPDENGVCPKPEAYDTPTTGETTVQSEATYATSAGLYFWFPFFLVLVTVGIVLFKILLVDRKKIKLPDFKGIIDRFIHTKRTGGKKYASIGAEDDVEEGANGVPSPKLNKGAETSFSPHISMDKEKDDANISKGKVISFTLQDEDIADDSQWGDDF